MLLASAVELVDAPLFSVASGFALLWLTLMEIVLGIDNIVFIAILTSRVPEEKRSMTRRVGLVLAMVMRILLLLAIGWLMSLESSLFELTSIVPADWIDVRLAERPEVNEVTGRDLVLLSGGLFLLFTAVREIHHKIDGEDEEDLEAAAAGQKSVRSVLFQIAVMDVIFSLDSVITAVGMAKHIPVMITAVVLAIIVMIIFANRISDFVTTHPTVKMLALSFLILIGVVLLSEAAGTPISKGYVYFAMTFSLIVEFLNLRMSSKRRATRRAAGAEASSVSSPAT